MGFIFCLFNFKFITDADLVLNNKNYANKLIIQKKN